MSNEKYEAMTAEQIINFRKVLADMIGPWALLMPDREIENVRNVLQDKLNKFTEDKIGENK
jgi:hypothetical protein